MPKRCLMQLNCLSAPAAAQPVKPRRGWMQSGLSELSTATVDDILTERRLEFVGEGKRYFDLVRAEGINGASSKNKATTALIPDEYGYRTNSWNSKKKYIPIAQGELDSDPALVQNDYK